jgi:hypothetical protein
VPAQVRAPRPHLGAIPLTKVIPQHSTTALRASRHPPNSRPEPAPKGAKAECYWQRSHEYLTDSSMILVAGTPCCVNPRLLGFRGEAGGRRLGAWTLWSRTRRP